MPTQNRTAPRPIDTGAPVGLSPALTHITLESQMYPIMRSNPVKAIYGFLTVMSKEQMQSLVIDNFNIYLAMGGNQPHNFIGNSADCICCCAAAALFVSTELRI